MKIMSFTLALILLGAGLTASAQDVFMATSEDLKEFDNLISKEKAPPPPPQNGSATAAPTNIKKKLNGQRDRFQNSRNRPEGTPPAQQPGFQQPPPPAGTEPGGNGRPPPPPPPRH